MKQTFTGSIYLIVNKINNKKYVGQTVQDVKVRFNSHCLKNSGCPKLRNAIQKYGKENFKIITLKVFACSDFETLHKQLDYWETWYIEYYHSVEQGYNCTYGGQNAKVYSEETKNKMSISMKKFYADHPEAKEKIRDRLKGNTIWKGKKRSPESIEKMKKAQSNRSKETREKLSKALTGIKRPNKWIPVLQYDLEGNFIKEWESMSAARKAFGVKDSHIGLVCRGKRKSCYGFVWKYKI